MLNWVSCPDSVQKRLLETQKGHFQGHLQLIAEKKLIINFNLKKIASQRHPLTPRK